MLLCWSEIRADLADRGIDVDARAVRRGHTWAWLKARIEGLLTAAPQLLIDRDGRVHRVPQTRLGLALDPPDPRPRPGGPQLDGDDD